MNFINCKIIVQILFVTIFLSTSHTKVLDKFYDSNQISNYFSGILMLNENQYGESYKFLKKLNGLETNHNNYSLKYLYSLVNSGNFQEAFNYSKKLEKQDLDGFESDLIMGVFHIKNSNFDLARKYFLKAKNGDPRLILNKYVAGSLYNWSNLKNFNLALIELDNLDERFDNLKKIQNVFLNCF